MNKTRQSEFYLVLITVIWGGTFVSIKVALEYVSPLLLMGLRFSSAFVFFLIINPVKISSLHKGLILKGLFLGILMFLGYGLQTIGLSFTTASRSGFITYFYALLVPVFQFLILKKKPLWANLGGLVLAFVGLSLITGGLGSGSMNRGDILTLFSAGSYSVYIVCLNLWSTDDDPAVLTALQLLITSILAFALIPLFEKPFLNPHPLLWANLLYLSLLGSVVAVYVMTRYQNSVTPTRAAILYSLEPVFSVVLAVFILGEQFSLLQIGGSLMIISGVLFSEILAIQRGSVQES
ncbi:DMT family transporter [Oceanispirochaeta sp.]|jgi:drug/metabolite transporter (DMT)-like permease|uniref:DMT family transporter n=1 Tax=Oceanispirochaeta sp. TaxID=2035350 RepID=UPI00262B6210|nr:DMT family transporter [Oceanispirochaeta sp.]MDA3955366.1 DMT family transporter [Oceanispirochaeta sp.]